MILDLLFRVICWNLNDPGGGNVVPQLPVTQFLDIYSQLSADLFLSVNSIDLSVKVHP